MSENLERGGGMKYDGGKLRMSLLPWDALEAVAEILTYGARKYSAHSWRGVPNGLERYKDALLRHWAKWESGEWADDESGLPHVAHIACNALFIASLALTGGTGCHPTKDGHKPTPTRVFEKVTPPQKTP